MNEELMEAICTEIFILVYYDTWQFLYKDYEFKFHYYNLFELLDTKTILKNTISLFLIVYVHSECYGFLKTFWKKENIY